MTSLFRMRYEISFLLITLVIGILVFSGSRQLPEPTYEPMGPAAFPGAIATITLLLALLKLIQLFVTRPAPLDKETGDSRFSRSLIMLLLFATFVAMINFFNLALWINTSLFLLSATLFLKKPTGIAPLIIQCLVIVVFSLLLHYISTQVLYLDL